MKWPKETILGLRREPRSEPVYIRKDVVMPH
jgi:hypothetical protein